MALDATPQKPTTDFNLFRSLVLVDTGRQRTPKELNPQGRTIRIMNNGSVYPGSDMMNKWNLEYTEKNEESTGNGIDVTDSADWDKFKDLPRVILFSVVPKTEPKVELFGTCRYNEDGTPIGSVMTQGSKSPLLLKLVKELGFMAEDQKYCDLVMLEDHAITFQDGISHVPKIVERGDRKGEKTYTRRENVAYYPVVTLEQYTEMSKVAPNEVVTI